jgi:uncharacterized protein (TIGR00730 family)
MSSLKSVCVYCGSSNVADPAYLALARRFGAAAAARSIRLVYGGGDVGLMGAAARAAKAGGGDVLGIMPRFLTAIEQPNPEIPTVIVETMHERKRLMFENADAFVVLPGGIGTLEEVVEMLSWRRLDLHAKPTVFVDSAFWASLFAFFESTISHRLTPPSFRACFAAVDEPEESFEALERVLAQAA